MGEVFLGTPEFDDFANERTCLGRSAANPNSYPSSLAICFGLALDSVFFCIVLAKFVSCV